MVHLGGSAILLHDDFGKIRDLGRVKPGLGEGFRGKVPFGHQTRAFRPERHDPHRPDIIDMRHDIG